MRGEGRIGCGRWDCGQLSKNVANGRRGPVKENLVCSNRWVNPSGVLVLYLTLLSVFVLLLTPFPAGIFDVFYFFIERNNTNLL